MNAEKTPKSQLNEEEIRAELEEAQIQEDARVDAESDTHPDVEFEAAQKFEEYRAAFEAEQSAENLSAENLIKESGERDSLPIQIMRQTLLAQEQYHSWRKVLIPLMVVVPGVLFLVVMWIIFCSTPEDSGIWTKNIFVSGFFITLVGFYTSLAKGLFGSGKDKDKSVAEKASDIAQSLTNSSGGS